MTVQLMPPRRRDLLMGLGAFGAPVALTAVLLPLGGQQQRYYVFVYRRQIDASSARN